MRRSSTLLAHVYTQNCCASPSSDLETRNNSLREKKILIPIPYTLLYQVNRRVLMIVLCKCALTLR